MAPVRPDHFWPRNPGPKNRAVDELLMMTALRLRADDAKGAAREAYLAAWAALEAERLDKRIDPLPTIDVLQTRSARLLEAMPDATQGEEVAIGDEMEKVLFWIEPDHLGLALRKGFGPGFSGYAALLRHELDDPRWTDFLVDTLSPRLAFLTPVHLDILLFGGELSEAQAPRLARVLSAQVRDHPETIASNYCIGRTSQPSTSLIVATVLAGAAPPDITGHPNLDEDLRSLQSAHGRLALFSRVGGIEGALRLAIQEGYTGGFGIRPGHGRRIAQMAKPPSSQVWTAKGATGAGASTPRRRALRDLLSRRSSA